MGLGLLIAAFVGLLVGLRVRPRFILTMVKVLLVVGIACVAIAAILDNSQLNFALGVGAMGAMFLAGPAILGVLVGLGLRRAFGKKREEE
jgi:hypothetical protein